MLHNTTTSSSSGGSGALGGGAGGQRRPGGGGLGSGSLGSGGRGSRASRGGLGLDGSSGRGPPVCAGAFQFRGSCAVSGAAVAARSGSHKAPPRARGPTNKLLERSQTHAGPLHLPAHSVLHALSHTRGPFPYVASAAGRVKPTISLGRVIWRKTIYSHKAEPRGSAQGAGHRPRPSGAPPPQPMFRCPRESPSQPCAQPATLSLGAPLPQSPAGCFGFPPAVLFLPGTKISMNFLFCIGNKPILSGTQW